MKPWERYRAIKAARENKDEATFMEQWEELRVDEKALADPTLGNVLLLEALRMAKGWRETDFRTSDKIIYLLESFRNDFSMDREDCKWYVAGMRLAMRVKETYPHFLEFIEWWGMENLQPEDFEPFRSPDGKVVMSLAERAYQAIGNALLDLKPFDAPRAEKFLDEMRQISEHHHDYTWLDFVESKLLIKLGRAEESLDLLKIFLSKKPKEYWAWAALASAAEHTNDINTAIACYAHATTLQRQEEYLVNVRENLGRLWLAAGELSAGRAEIDIAYQVRMEVWGKIPESLRELMASDAYLKAPAHGNNRGRYRSLGILARQYAAEGLPRLHGIVINVVKGDRGDRLYIASGRESVFGYPGNLASARLNPGDFVTLYQAFDGSIVLIHPEQHPPRLDFVREEEGILMRNQRGFGFVNQLFIPPHMIAPLPNDPTLKVYAIAVWNYNKKRDEWGWQVVSAIPA